MIQSRISIEMNIGKNKITEIEGTSAGIVCKKVEKTKCTEEMKRNNADTLEIVEETPGVGTHESFHPDAPSIENATYSPEVCKWFKGRISV